MGQYVRTPTDLGPQLLIHFPRDTTLLSLKLLIVLALVTLLSLTHPHPRGSPEPNVYLSAPCHTARRSHPRQGSSQSSGLLGRS